MAEDITKLVLQVESGKVTIAARDLDRLTRSSKGTEKATDGVSAAFKRLLAPLLATVSAYQGLKKLVSITREFDILNAQLITATGSAENAVIAFGAIQDFATTTPFQLGEVTEAFVQLVNRGLDPSEKSLTNIGNFASAYGRNILDATRAIGQATTGEFESLKQFGIVAKKQGDEVQFIFRGMKETVAFETGAIQDYMNRLAENNFAGAMANRMDTLDGALSNLQDSWDKFWLNISQGGSGSQIEEIVRGLILSIETLDKYLNNSETSMEGVLITAEDLRDAMVTVGVVTNRLWKTVELGTKSGEVAMLALASVASGVFTKVVVTVTEKVEEAFNAPIDAINDLIYKINNLPPNVKKLLGLGDDDLAYIEVSFDINTQGLEDLNSSIGAARRQAVDEWQTAYDALANADENFLKRINQGIEMAAGKFRQLVVDVDTGEQYYVDENFNRIGGDRLKQFGVGATSNEEDEAISEAEQREIERRKNALDRLDDYLTQEWDIREAAFIEEELQLEEKFDRELEILEEAREKELLTKEKYDALKLKSEERLQKQIEDLKKREALATQQQQLQNYQTVLSMAGDLSGQLQQLASDGSDAQKALFVASKGIAMAQAIINTELAATRALAEGGFILGIPMATAIRAMGYASVALMAAQTIQQSSGGNFATGGIVGGSSYSGDKITANVNSGEMILNAAQQRNLFDMANNGGGSGVNVTVVNNSGERVDVQERDGSNGKELEIIIGQTEKALAAGIAQGGSPLGRSLENTYKLNRG